MSLPEPTIDDRDYEEILDEALSRIPVHNPEWTNYNESDPGVTMLQVISFVVESMLYRANRVPERNRVKFLKLLGIERQPATVAEGLVQFSRPRGRAETEVVEGETEVRAGSVPFRTRGAVEVLPVVGRVYYKKERSFGGDSATEQYYRQLFDSFDREQPGDLSFYETTRLPEPKPGAPLPEVDLNEDTAGSDQSLWLALLTRPGTGPGEREAVRKALAGSELSLAVVPALEDAARVLPPQGETDTGRQGGLEFAIPRLDRGGPQYRPLEARTEQNLLVEPGVVDLKIPEFDGASGAGGPRAWQAPGAGEGPVLDPLEEGTGGYPPSLEETNVRDRLVTWIRIQPEAAAGTAKSSLPARFSTVAVNAARVEQRARVETEYLGKGTGDPDQQVQLTNTPVLPESVELTVGGERWRQIDDLVAAPPEVPRSDPRRAPGEGTGESGDPRVYALDRTSGTITFGDGLRGARPSSGAVIEARYDYGGGSQGVVGIGSIKKGPKLPAGVKVTNPISTWGGASQEDVEEAERRIAEYLKRRDRAVTAGDFDAIAERTPGVDLGRVEVLPLVHPESGLTDVRAEGVVTVLVIPASDPNRPDAPVPDRLFLDTVCDYLDRRRLVTSEVHVRGPRYKNVYVSTGIDVRPGEDVPPVREAVRSEIRTFLSPLEGGFEGDGWPLQRAVDERELLTVAARVDGVASVDSIALAGPGGEAMEEVPMDGVELPRLSGLAAKSGPATPMDELYAQTGPSAEPGAEGETEEPPSFLPVPVVPEEC
jgi:hypothetical protein